MAKLTRRVVVVHYEDVLSCSRGHGKALELIPSGELIPSVGFVGSGEPKISRLGGLLFGWVLAHPPVSARR